MEAKNTGNNNVRPLRQAGEIAPRIPPHNYEAEMALLGALLANNLVFDKVNEFLRPDHFADALHGRIYQAAGKLIERGQIANALADVRTQATNDAPDAAALLKRYPKAQARTFAGNPGLV